MKHPRNKAERIEIEHSLDHKLKDREGHVAKKRRLEAVKLKELEDATSEVSLETA